MTGNTNPGSFPPIQSRARKIEALDTNVVSRFILTGLLDSHNKVALIDAQRRYSEKLEEAIKDESGIAQDSAEQAEQSSTLSKLHTLKLKPKCRLSHSIN